LAEPIPLFRPKKLHTQVVDKIGQLIAGGHFAEGEKLPTEAELSEQFGVSRSVMREVSKILMAKGLVSSKPRVGTVVQERQFWNMLDDEVMSWTIAALPESEFLDMLFAARLAFEPGAAQLAAQQATDDDIKGICNAYYDMESATSAEQLLEPDVRFHLAIVDATHNPIVRHIGRALHKALTVSIALTSRHPETYSLSLPRHKAVMQAVMKRDTVAAAKATIKLLEESREDFRSVQHNEK
jgi:GntR family transcriptional regulator, galactonate operon transcriptional repressor